MAQQIDVDNISKLFFELMKNIAYTSGVVFDVVDKGATRALDTLIARKGERDFKKYCDSHSDSIQPDNKFAFFLCRSEYADKVESKMREMNPGNIPFRKIYDEPTNATIFVFPNTEEARNYAREVNKQVIASQSRIARIPLSVLEKTTPNKEFGVINGLSAAEVGFFEQKAKTEAFCFAVARDDKGKTFSVFFAKEDKDVANYAFQYALMKSNLEAFSYDAKLMAHTTGLFDDKISPRLKELSNDKNFVIVSSANPQAYIEVTSSGFDYKNQHGLIDSIPATTPNFQTDLAYFTGKLSYPVVMSTEEFDEFKKFAEQFKSDDMSIQDVQQSLLKTAVIEYNGDISKLMTAIKNKETELPIFKNGKPEHGYDAVRTAESMLSVFVQAKIATDPTFSVDQIEKIESFSDTFDFSDISSDTLRSHGILVSKEELQKRAASLDERCKHHPRERAALIENFKAIAEEYGKGAKTTYVQATEETLDAYIERAGLRASDIGGNSDSRTYEPR